MDFDPKDPDILNKIAEAIINGADPEQFRELIDQILGTMVPERDLEKEGLYQDRIGYQDP